MFTVSETTSELLPVHGTKKELSHVEEPEMIHILKEDLTVQCLPSKLMKYINLFLNFRVDSQKTDTEFSPVDVVYSPNIIHGEPLMDRKSTFQAHATEVHSSQEVALN